MSASYLDLKAWQKAMALTLDIYRCSRAFPKEEVYGLTSQLRRSAVSIPSNIAEGNGRHSQKELLQFLFRARGSLLELDTQLMIAKELGYLAETDFARLRSSSAEVGRMLNGLISRFQQLTEESRKYDNTAAWWLSPTPEA
jgi:four helix bundle protein